MKSRPIQQLNTEDVQPVLSAGYTQKDPGSLPVPGNIVLIKIAKHTTEGKG